MAFRSQIAALSDLIADKVVGALIATAETGLRWELLSSGVANKLFGYTGDAAESQPGWIQVVREFASGYVGGRIEMLAPQFFGTVGGSVVVSQLSNGQSYASIGSGGSNDAHVTVSQTPGVLSGAGDSAVQIDAQRSVSIKAGRDGIVFRSYQGGGDAQQCFTGNEGVLKGAAAPAGMPKLQCQGTVVVTVGASGAFSFNYHDGGFPNGLVSLFLFAGDNSVSGLSVVPVLGNCTLTLAYGQAFNGAGSLVPSGSGIRVNYIAIGW